MENVIDRLNKIDHIIGSGDLSQSEFLKYILTLKAERNYLFNKVEANFTKEWFLYLGSLGAFSFDTIPLAKEDVKEDGSVNYWFYGWDAALLIKKSAEISLEKPDSNLSLAILKLVNEYIDYVNANENNKSRNPRPDWFFCDYILLLPLEKITDEHFSFIIKYGLPQGFGNVTHDLATSFFERLVKSRNRNIIVKLLDIFYTITTTTEASPFDVKSIVDSYSLKEFVNTSADNLVDVLGNETLNWFEERIKLIYKAYPASFSMFTIVSIDEDNQNWHSDGLSNLIVKHFRNCIVSKNIDVEYLKGKILELFESKIPVLKRIAVFAINNRFSAFNTIFWAINNPLADNNCKLENFKLIENNCKGFDDGNVRQLMNWIEEIEFERFPEYSDEEQTKYEAYHRLEWYLALNDIEAGEFGYIFDRIKDLREISPVEPSHPGYSSWHEVRAGGDYSIKRISDQALSEIPERLNNKEQWEGYDQWGLQEDLRAVIVNRADEVIANIDLFYSIEPGFLYYLFDAFRTLAEQKKQIHWNSFLDFAIKLLETRSDLWDFNDDKSNDKSNSIGMLAWLLKDMSKTDILLQLGDNAKDKIISILSVIDANYVKDFEYLNQDSNKNFDIINSTRGKLYEAMLTLSLTIAKEAGSDEQRWENRIKDIFTHRLSDGSFYDEFYWIIGMYTPQISYLDREWWLGHLESIYIRNQQVDDCAFQAYLYYNTKLYSDIFHPLSKCYSAAVDKYLNDGVLAERLVQHFIIAFSTDLENSKEFLDKIFSSKNLSFLKYAVEYIVDRYIILSIEKVKYLWKIIIEKAKKHDSILAKNIIYATADFIKLFEVADDDCMDLFRKAVECYSAQPRIHRLLEFAFSYISKDPKVGGQILQLLVNRIEGYYSFGNEKLISGIEALYKADEKSTADLISIHLAEQGNFYVVKIYNKYNTVESS